MRHMPLFLLLLSAWVAAPHWVTGQDDVAEVPASDLKIGNDANKRYFLIGAKPDTKAPESGFGLVIILPGGGGDAGFHPFVKRIYKNALPEGYLVAQPVAIKWTPQQQIVWPTAKSKVSGQKFSTEEFVSEIIKDVAAKHKIDPARVFTLSWSSSGPAAYACALSNPSITGSFVAMSVFKPDQLPSLDKGKGHGFYLYHSPDDKTCPYRMAQQAEQALRKAGAKVKLTTYAGGHGWKGPLYDQIREGIEWLEKNHAYAP